MPPLTRRTAVAGSVLAVATVLLSVLLVDGPEDRPVQQPAPGGTPTAAERVPALWLQLSDAPTEADLEAAAGRFRVAVLNPWETGAAAWLQERDPEMVVLAYKCLSSTRSYEGAVIDGRDAEVLPTGVGFVAAQEHPDWFATDADGERIEGGTYPGHWQMAVWEPAYRRAWAEAVVEELAGGPFDGVMADNALATLDHYSDADLAGGRVDADLRAGVAALVNEAGPALQERGLVLVPNVSEGRLHESWWPSLTQYGGGFEEQFVHFGPDPDSGYLDAGSSSGWRPQVQQLGIDGLVLARTSAGPDDRQAFLYGLASFWLGSGGRGAFAATERDAYDGTALREEQTWHLGRPTGPPEQREGMWRRGFDGGLVLVNPSPTETLVATVPAGTRDRDGPVGSEVRLPPTSGAVLRSSEVPPTG